MILHTNNIQPEKYFFCTPSNANVGGPATAAGFAGLLGRQCLVVPATIYGTLGYAIATTLGIGLYRALLSGVTF